MERFKESKKSRGLKGQEQVSLEALVGHIDIWSTNHPAHQTEEAPSSCSQSVREDDIGLEPCGDAGHNI